MKIVKYIINDIGVPTLFKTDILHADMATNAVSAGFAIISYDSLTDNFCVKCYGGSESLKIGISKKDCLIIQNYLNKVVSHSDKVEYEDDKLDRLFIDGEIVILNK